MIAMIYIKVLICFSLFQHTSFPQNNFSNRPSSTEPPRTESASQLNHGGYHQAFVNNYHQYYPQANWGNHHAETSQNRTVSQEDSNSSSNAYSGTAQNLYGPSANATQWNSGSSNAGRDTTESWNTPHWDYRDWQHRGTNAFSSHYPSYSSETPSRYQSLNPQESSAQKTASNISSDSSIMQPTHENNYQRTLQYVEQCQVTWNNGADKTSQRN